MSIRRSKFKRSLSTIQRSSRWTSSSYNSIWATKTNSRSSTPSRVLLMRWMQYRERTQQGLRLPQTLTIPRLPPTWMSTNQLSSSTTATSLTAIQRKKVTRKTSLKRAASPQSRPQARAMMVPRKLDSHRDQANDTLRIQQLQPKPANRQRPQQQPNSNRCSLWTCSLAKEWTKLKLKLRSKHRCNRWTWIPKSSKKVGIPEWIWGHSHRLSSRWPLEAWTIKASLRAASSPIAITDLPLMLATSSSSAKASTIFPRKTLAPSSPIPTSRLPPTTKVSTWTLTDRSQQDCSL